MMSCRSSKQMTEQKTTERQTDSTGDTLVVYIHTTDTLIVHDTVRETTIVQLNADGDTTRKDTKSEHITDRTRQQKTENVREVSHQESHEKEATNDKKETVVEQAKSSPIKPFLWGSLTGILLTIAAIIFVRLRKR